MADLLQRPTNARRVVCADGFESVVTVTLPAGYREGMRLPAMFWFYPREYTDQEGYDERLETYNKNKEYGKAADEVGAQDIADKAASSYTKEFLFSLSNSERETINLVEEALARIPFTVTVSTKLNTGHAIPSMSAVRGASCSTW